MADKTEFTKTFTHPDAWLQTWTPAQRELAAKHGTVNEFREAVEDAIRSGEISATEGRAAVEKYRNEWQKDGKPYSDQPLDAEKVLRELEEQMTKPAGNLTKQQSTPSIG